MGLAEAGRVLEQQAGATSPGAGAGTVLRGDGTQRCSLQGSAGRTRQEDGSLFGSLGFLQVLKSTQREELGSSCLGKLLLGLLLACKSAAETCSSGRAWSSERAVGLILPGSWHRAVSSPEASVTRGQRSSAAFGLRLFIFLNLRITVGQAGCSN